MTDTEQNDETKDTEKVAPAAEVPRGSAEETSEAPPAEIAEEASAPEAAAEPAAEEAAPAEEAAVQEAPAEAEVAEAQPEAASEPAPEAASAPPAPPPVDKGPAKAKLKELKVLRDKALESGDRVGVKRERARIRRLKRRTRKAG